MAAGLTSAAIERLRAAAEQHVGDTRVPGLVALVARGDDVYAEAFGRHCGGRPAVQRDSLFRIASMTKPITAAVTMALVGEGLIGLDQPVDRLLPELADRRVLRRPDGPLEETVAASRAITTRDLLTFTEPDPDTWIAGLGSLPLIAQPGERWLYNTGASVLGVLVARAVGQPFEDVLRTRLFEPLGMRDTAFWTPRTERLATGYLPTQMGLKVWDEPDGRWSRRPDFADGAGGLVSTADDLLGPGFFENLSWGFCQAVYPNGAFGWNGGFGTSWLVEPDEDLTVIVLTQRLFESPEPPPVHVDIRAAALETGKAM